MWFSSWLRNWVSRRALRIRQHRAAPPRFRPRLETLQHRDLPSPLTVLNTTDSGPGSLRAKIPTAGNKDTIIFNSSLAGQTITLTSGELVIDKSLNIEGPGGNDSPVIIDANFTSRVFHLT